MTFLDISNVYKSYGDHTVLSDISLQIPAGEFVVFVGPSGCGKSTLLRMISGLESITAGTISLDGEELNDVEPSKRGIAMVFQSYALYPHMTTFENVSFGLRMAHESKSVIRQKVQAVAEILQLEKLLDRRPANLSGGQKQRVAIGRAIVRDPRIFLFDEPLSNLDAELRVQMRAELTDLHRRLQVTMIYVTHDQVEAMTLADTMVVMHAGKLQQVGPPLQLYDDPDNMFVAGFVGSPRMNFLVAQAAPVAGGVQLSDLPGGISVRIPGHVGVSGTVTIGIRPEFISPLVGSEPTPPDAMELSGLIVFAEELGDVTYLHIELVEGGRLIARCPRNLRPEGTTARLSLDLSHVLLFDEAGERLRVTDQIAR